MMPGRTRKFLTESDKETIKKEVQVKGKPPAVIAEWYGVSEFTVMKIAGILNE